MFRGCLLAIGGLFAIVALALVVGGLSGDRPAPATSPTSRSATSSPGYYQLTPPQDFRGIKWGDPLPPSRRLRETVLHGCSKIIELAHLRDTVPCAHSHTETDDMDFFGQTENVPPFFGVRVSSQLFVWSEKKFWAGHIFIYNYSEVELTRLRAALAERFGQPKVTSTKSRMDEWIWPNQKIQLLVLYDPVTRPSLDPKLAPATSIQVMMGKFEWFSILSHRAVEGYCVTPRLLPGPSLKLAGCPLFYIGLFPILHTRCCKIIGSKNGEHIGDTKRSLAQEKSCAAFNHC
jgi:hypothetical protein